MKAVLASRNKHKIKELQSLLARYIPQIEILSLDDVGFEGDIIEDGKTFEENALIKARAAASTGYIGLGDDSGLSVRALGGEPGIYSARYAGEHGDDEANNRLLLEKLSDKADRYAEFVCVIACVFPDKHDCEVVCRGVTEGTVIDSYRGNNGFGYDPLFFCNAMGKTYAEMTSDEKNAVSHRGKAVELFAQKLNSIENERFK